MVRTPCFHCRGPGFNPWSGSTAKRKKNKKVTHRKPELPRISHDFCCCCVRRQCRLKHDHPPRHVSQKPGSHPRPRLLALSPRAVSHLMRLSAPLASLESTRGLRPLTPAPRTGGLCAAGLPSPSLQHGSGSEGSKCKFNQLAFLAGTSPPTKQRRSALAWRAQTCRTVTRPPLSFPATTHTSPSWD